MTCRLVFANTFSRCCVVWQRLEDDSRAARSAAWCPLWVSCTFLQLFQGSSSPFDQQTSPLKRLLSGRSSLCGAEALEKPLAHLFRVRSQPNANEQHGSAPRVTPAGADGRSRARRRCRCPAPSGLPCRWQHRAAYCSAAAALVPFPGGGGRRARGPRGPVKSRARCRPRR